MPDLQSPIAPAEELTRWVADARATTLAMVEDLSPEELIGAYLETVNPFIWHMGHIAWFQERWVLRHLRGRPLIDPMVDKLFDSFEVAHETRWSLNLPRPEAIRKYMERVLDDVVADISATEPAPDSSYFNRLAVFHENMHGEAMLYDRQTMQYPLPPSLKNAPEDPSPGPLPGDVEVPGSPRFMLGATPDLPYVFDNEKWAHPVEVAPFRIARAAVTNGDFAGFVAAGGYRDSGYWGIRGGQWLKNSGVSHPLYWEPDHGGGWKERWFSEWRPLREHHPVMHVCWFEAEAYCNWAGRRLPTEAEWELAASAEPGPHGATHQEKRSFPWGEAPPEATTACLNARTAGPVGVAGLPAGESAFGCRQMIGNVWEWTADAFYPFPGFVVDPYREYSAPWFGYNKVLKGGCWATPSRMIRNTWRNFFLPHRRDIFAGFRTCAR